MTSKLNTENTDCEEMIVLDCDGQLRKTLPQQQFSGIPKEFLTHRATLSKKLQAKVNSLKSGKPSDVASLDPHTATMGNINRGYPTPPMYLRNYQKPWPSRKSSGCEELVKHVPNVPCYLQHIDRGDNLQEKALNVGVLDWGRLEKWTHKQKRMTTGRGGYSPTGTKMISPFSSCGSSTGSRRSFSSPLSPRKQSPPLKAGRNASAEGWPMCTMEEKNSIDLRHKHEKGGITESELKDTPSNGSQRQYEGTSPSKDLKTLVSQSNMQKERPPYCSNLDMHQDWPLEKSMSITENIEGTRDHLLQDAPRKCSSFKSIAFKDASLLEVKHDCFSQNLPPEDAQFTGLSLQVPHSCPLPSATVTGEPDVVTTAPDANEISTTTLKDKNENRDYLSGLPCEFFEVSMGERLGRDETKASHSVARGLSPNRRYSSSVNWMIRSSSSKEKKRQMKETANSDNLIGDKASANSRGRRSPLRRMLDPLLKPMNRINLSGPITSHHVDELNETDKPPIQETRSTQRLQRSSDENSDAFSNPQGSCLKETHRASTKQALLQLAWKNGLPLLMLSSTDSDILAATIRKRNDSIKDDVECIYTIFIVHEVKKKSGIWMNHGSKSKNHGLVSNVVGQINVSCPKLCSYNLYGHSVMREFVLLGAELAPASHETIGPGLSTELAAIVVKDPNEFPKNSNCHMIQSNGSSNSTQKYTVDDGSSNYHVESLKLDLNATSSSLSTIFAILPSAVHGLSAEGEPSPLIERWKSGGSCDCGGWDEGCMLTILCDRHQDSVEAPDGTQRIELFIQGGFREKRHAFSMVSFKEGLYTVDFEPSIALLQVFAICIATLHSRKPPSHLMAHCPMEAKSIEEDLFADHSTMPAPTTKEEDTATYVPNCPPLSPFGRA